jgi:uncharacterized protein (UPF0276 family)
VVAAAAAAEVAVADRVGIGWRPEIATALVRRLDEIDLLEVIAENFMDRRGSAALRALSAEVPVVLHGVSLGLASAHPVDEGRLGHLARLVETARLPLWSEHLAFVRAGGCEIGHLAAPPRTVATIEGTLRNLARACAVVGTAPKLENIATLIAPPGSTLDECAWIGAIAAQTDATLLLDLHNLYANAVNFGADPHAMLHAMPLARVRVVHLSGGVWIGGHDGERERLLDDHLHDVPQSVYGLLEALAAHVAQPLDVIIERDGRYPPIGDLLAQVRAARAALARGRARTATTKERLAA